MLKKNSVLLRRRDAGHRVIGRDNADVRELNSRIGGMLREYYRDVVSEGIPPRFLELLKKLETEGQSVGEARPDDRIHSVQGWAARVDS
jgi:hypothetical protein